MGCFLLIIIDIFSLNTPNIHEMILMILAWFYLPRAFDFWALYAEIKKKLNVVGLFAVTLHLHIFGE